MSIANKVAKESKFFLRLTVKACPEYKVEGKKLWQEAHELNLIFTTIIKKAKDTEVKNKLKQKI
jgi:hypothetical protein